MTQDKLPIPSKDVPPKLQGGDYRPHYRQDETDAYVEHLKRDRAVAWQNGWDSARAHAEYCEKRGTHPRPKNPYLQDVLRDEPSAKQRVLAVHPKAEMMHVPQPMDGDCVRVYIPLSGWHLSDIWTGSGERAAWEDAASKLSPVPPSPDKK